MLNSFLNELRKIKMSNAILYIVIGALLFLVPNLSLRIVCYVIGAVLIYKGILSFVSYQRAKAFYGLPIDLIAAIAYIGFGLVLVFGYAFFLSLIPVIIAIFMIADGIQTLFNASSLKGQGYGGATATMVRGIVVVLIGFIIFLNPFGTITTTLSIIGFVLIVDGISELIDSYNIHRWMK